MTGDRTEMEMRDRVGSESDVLGGVSVIGRRR